MMGNAVALIRLVTTVFLGLSLASAGGGSTGQGDGPLPVDALQVNYESGQGHEGSPEFRADEVIVGFDPNALPAERQLVLQEHGCWIARTCDLAALLASHGVTSPDKIREAMEQTARDLGPSGWDPQYGWGLIDAHAALVYRMPAAR